MVKSGVARLQTHSARMQCEIYLTNERLVFKSMSNHGDLYFSEVALADVEGVETCTTKLWGMIPVAPTSLQISVKGGDRYWLVLVNRNEWAHAIGAIMQAAAGLKAAQDDARLRRVALRQRKVDIDLDAL